MWVVGAKKETIAWEENPAGRGGEKKRGNEAEPE